MKNPFDTPNISPSYRTRRVRIDADCLERLESLGFETGLYQNSGEPIEDSYEQILNLVIEQFENNTELET